MSQKTRQQWFQEAEEKSKSGEWDDGAPPPSPPHPDSLSVYPTAITGDQFFIPGLHSDCQVMEYSGTSE